jgi:hypothetical protein
VEVQVLSSAPAQESIVYSGFLSQKLRKAFPSP